LLKLNLILNFPFFVFEEGEAVFIVKIIWRVICR
jgi:hypothetical protein